MATSCTLAGARSAVLLAGTGSATEGRELPPPMRSRSKLRSGVLAGARGAFAAAVFAPETSTDGASQAGLAKAYRQVGDIQRILGRMAKAAEAYSRGAALYTRLSAPGPGRLGYRKELARFPNNRIAALHLRAIGQRLLKFSAVRRRETGQHDKRFAKDNAQPRQSVIAPFFNRPSVRV